MAATRTHSAFVARKCDMISIKPTIVGDVGRIIGAPQEHGGVPISIFVLEGNRLHTRIEGDCGSKDIILEHMEGVFSQATLFCRGGMSIAALWMPPCGFVAAMSIRLKDKGLNILPGGHMDIEIFASEPMCFLRSLRMSDFSIVFEDQHGLARVHGMTGIVPFSVLCRRLHSEGFRGAKPGQDAPARRVWKEYA